jgi:hypothetical protein
MIPRDEWPAADPLDCAVDALCSQPVPPGPPAGVAVRTIEALRGASPVLPVSRPLPFDRRTLMFRTLRIGGAAAAAVLVAVGLGAWLVPAGRSDAGFAEVQRRVGKVRNVQFMQHQKLTPGSQVIPVRTTIEGPHFRLDVPDGPVVIADTALRKAIQLEPGRKTAGWLPVNDDLLDRVLGSVLDEILALRPADAQPAGREDVDGRPADVYHLKRFRFFGFDSEKAGPDDLKLTLWADAETHLPVKIEMSFNSGPPGRPNPSVIVMDGFRWDLELDPALFRVEVPAGYTEIEAAKPPADAPKPPHSYDDE